MMRYQWLVVMCLIISTTQICCSKNAPKEKASSGKNSGDLLKDLSKETVKIKTGLEKTSLGMSQYSVELKIVSDLRKRFDKWQRQVLDSFEVWSGYEPKVKLPAASTVYRTNDSQIRKSRTAITKSGTDRLKTAEKTVREMLKSAAGKDELAKVEKENLVPLVNDFQKHLDADLKVFVAEVEAARDGSVLAEKGVIKDTFAQQLDSNKLKKIKQLKENAADCQVVWGKEIEMVPDSPISILFLSRLFKGGLANSLPQQDLIKVINTSLMMPNSELSRKALSILAETDDVVVYERCATKENLRLLEFRKLITGRLPALILASKMNNTTDGLKLMVVLADSYLSDPQPSHANELDQLIKSVQDANIRCTKEFVWLLAGAAFSGSGSAEQELVKLFANQPLSNNILYLHTAASKTSFNELVGAIIAKSGGKNPNALFHQCISTICVANKGFNQLTIPDMNDFLAGWFGAVDVSFASEAFRIYKLILEDPKGEKLTGNEKILGSYEAFRHGAVSLVLRSANGLPIEQLYQVNKLVWQSERVVVLTTLQKLGQMEKVQTKSLSAIVENPWEGTAAYSGSIFSKANQHIRINEWILYASALEERSKSDAINSFRLIFLGQTALHKSLAGEGDMYPYRIYSLRRLMKINPDWFLDLIKYASTENCPATLRRAILCEYAAGHDRIGNTYIEKIPTTMPVKMKSRYVDGMLMAFDVVRTGKESNLIKSADVDTIHGYAYTLFCYDNPDLTKFAQSALKYKSIRQEPPVADVQIMMFDHTSAKGISPFHLMNEDQLTKALKRLNPDLNPKTIAEGYETWAEKVWPHENIETAPLTIEEVRNRYIKKHRLLEFKSDEKANAGLAKGGDANLSIESARRIVFNWRSYEPEHIRRSLKLLMSDKDGFDGVLRLVESISKGGDTNAKFGRESNPSIFLQYQAAVLEAIYPDLQSLEIETTDLQKQQRFKLKVVPSITKFIEEGTRTLAKIQEASRK